MGGSWPDSQARRFSGTADEALLLTVVEIPEPAPTAELVTVRPLWQDSHRRVRLTIGASLVPVGRDALPLSWLWSWWGLPAGLAVPVVPMLAGVAQVVLTGSAWPYPGVVLVAGCAGLWSQASRRDKFVVWSRLLRGLPPTAQEQILDLGCGRGALLVLAARGLTTGRAVGVDLWTAGQSGNSPAATLRNAAAADVADRVGVETADLTALPFPERSFDYVIFNLAVHNVRSPGARDRALNEAVRVLRPGGRLLLAVIRHTRRNRDRIRGSGMRAVHRQSLGSRMWWSRRWLRTHMVSAQQPAGLADRAPPT
jgi:arsenite methyltransferase